MDAPAHAMRSVAGAGSEGFGLLTTPASELSNKEISGPATVSTASQTNYPLLQYIIKGSYNTASSGSFVSLDAINYVLSRGCRFIDFEVFMIGGVVYVATSNDPNYVIGSSNKILLTEVLGNIVTHAFIAPTPNPGDPLFLQLRIKSNNNDIYGLISSIISSKITNKLYNGNVTPHTMMSDIMGKIILIVDKTVAPNYSLYPDCTKIAKGATCHSLATQVNMVAGGDSLLTYCYSDIMDMSNTPPHVNDDNTTVKFFGGFNIPTVATPDIDNSNLANPMPAPFYLNHAVNILLYRYYLNDSGLIAYEKMFSAAGYAIVPMGTMMKKTSKPPGS